MNEDMADESPALEPKGLVEKLESLKEGVSMNLLRSNDIIRRINEIIPSVQVLEQQHNQAQELTTLQNTSFFQTASVVSDEILGAASRGFSAQVWVGKDGKIDLSKLQTSIRTSGTQDRHVTPINFVERASRDTIKPKYTPQQIITNMLARLQSLLPDKSLYINKDKLPSDAIDTSSKETYIELDNADYIQNIFDYFGKLPNPTETDIEKLILLAATLYNEIPELALSDKYLRVEDNTNDRYIVPPAEFNEKSEMVHKAEGSFIAAHIKQLGAYEWILGSVNSRLSPETDESSTPISDNSPRESTRLRETFTRPTITDPFSKPNDSPKKQSSDGEKLNPALTKLMKMANDESRTGLTDIELQRVIYSVYATFDYLPLHGEEIAPKKTMLDKTKHRYHDEPKERLHRLAANHLNLFFTSHPLLHDQYQKEIIEGFLHYVANGVQTEDIQFICDEEELKKQAKAKKLDDDNFLTTKGFIDQYVDEEEIREQSAKKTTDKAKIESDVEAAKEGFRQELFQAVCLNLRTRDVVFYDRIMENDGVYQIFSTDEEEAHHKKFLEKEAITRQLIRVLEQQFLQFTQGKSTLTKNNTNRGINITFNDSQKTQLEAMKKLLSENNIKYEVDIKNILMINFENQDDLFQRINISFSEPTSQTIISSNNGSAKMNDTTGNTSTTMLGPSTANNTPEKTTHSGSDSQKPKSLDTVSDAFLMHSDSSSFDHTAYIKNNTKQLISDQINYIGEALFTKERGINTDQIKFLGVQQAHLRAQSADLQRAFTNPEGTVQKALSSKQKVASIYNAGAGHWAAYMLVPRGNTLYVLYKDSFGHEPNDEFKTACEKLKQAPFTNVQIMCSRTIEQLEGIHCGVFALNNIEIMAKLSDSQIDAAIAKKNLADVVFSKAGEKNDIHYLAAIQKMRDQFAELYDKTSQRVLEQKAQAFKNVEERNIQFAIPFTLALNKYLASKDKDFTPGILGAILSDTRSNDENLTNWHFNIRVNLAELKKLPTMSALSDAKLQEEATKIMLKILSTFAVDNIVHEAIFLKQGGINLKLDPHEAMQRIPDCKLSPLPPKAAPSAPTTVVPTNVTPVVSGNPSTGSNSNNNDAKPSPDGSSLSKSDHHKAKGHAENNAHTIRRFKSITAAQLSSKKNYPMSGNNFGMNFNK